jgi:DNA-binding LacI/PurR family transcriptional regulator
MCTAVRPPATSPTLTGSVCKRLHLGVPSPPPVRSRATIEDVAAAAGVSVATVSRALRGLPNVAESTRTRVSEVATSMHYRPDPSASRLAAGRSHSVAIVVPVLSGWYFSQVIAGAEAVINEAGYDMLVLGVTDEADRHRLLEVGRTIGQRVDGLLLVDVAVEPDEADALQARGLRVVTVGTTTANFPGIRIDDVHVGRLATEHLLQLGHRRIGLVGGDSENPLYFDPPVMRRRGFDAAMAAAGADIDESLVASGNFSTEGGHEAMLQLLAHPSPPTAVFAMSDEMAFGALIAARERGVGIPDDVSLIGVDDHEFAKVVELTTIHQSVTQHGSQAARMLLDSLDGRSDAVRGLHYSDVHLVVRASTAPLPRQR